jgi:two-component system cell cycle response regulator
VIVLPGCDVQSALVQAERLRQAFAAEPFDTAQIHLPVTCSIGLSSRNHPSEKDGNTLLREADRALYLAKGEGRNRVIAHGNRASVCALPL